MMRKHKINFFFRDEYFPPSLCCPALIIGGPIMLTVVHSHAQKADSEPGKSLDLCRESDLPPVRHLYQ